MGKLRQDSGSSPEQRRDEADRLIEMVQDYTEQMTHWERCRIVEWADPNRDISPQMLFILRDIKDKYL